MSYSISSIMLNLTIGVFGERAFINELGKKSTVNDMSIHHHYDSTHVFTFVASNSDKIQPLMQALQMAEVPILVLRELTPQVGEEIIGLSEMNFEKGFTILDGFPEDKYRNLIKGTSLEKFEIIGKNVGEVYEKLMAVQIKRGTDVIVPIDNFFNVKGIGTVILGVIRSGTVNKYDTLILEPLGKDATIKGIQIQDKDFNIAEPGSRVGFNLKDIDVSDLRRGQILSNKPLTKIAKLPNKILKNKFYKSDVKDNEQVIVSSGLQCAVAVVRGNELTLDKEIVAQKPILVASTKQESLRIIGRVE
ncbi:MAG: EF-Tu/IF-2/RF-3 family GTPase [Candidatus Aenigmatarchaeota archaeon]